MKELFVRFSTTGKIYFYEAKDAANNILDLKPDQGVLVETDQIVEEGIVVEKPKSQEAEEGTGKILKAFGPDDRQTHCQLKKLAGEFIDEARERVFRHGLNINILDADLSFDQKKLTFYFSAPGRVDFRGLVLDFAKSFNKLIRLQQVGAREEAKCYGGIGKCGREFCCKKFINNLDGVNSRMIEMQDVAGANKMTGCCGRPMCCLLYEEPAPMRKKKAEKEII